ncbi:hypothetical protein WOLCODRAFT_166124 [Wolfiporia cocos MD-104 SS10]|uniref:Uncharacterized protein n=1 Tax=Wolfiporia cocos (strain MD-104) TaxID=742152 RepID=A0A2H3J619_WOLCO|nr:hypothetical protein WOLCODRAFT_166124 [Wolfiporia cocos MD-104 SS10]
MLPVLPARTYRLLHLLVRRITIRPPTSIVLTGRVKTPILAFDTVLSVLISVKRFSYSLLRDVPILQCVRCDDKITAPQAFAHPAVVTISSGTQTPWLQKRQQCSYISSASVYVGIAAPPIRLQGLDVEYRLLGVQSYLLYSVLDVLTTCNETERPMDQLGIISGHEKNDGWHVLKRRMDELTIQDVPAAMQEQVFFRIEFSAINGAPPSASQTPTRCRTRCFHRQTRSWALGARNDMTDDLQFIIELVLEKRPVSIQDDLSATPD